MRIAWKVRVAGSLFWPGRKPRRGDDRGQLGGPVDGRAATMARAIARARGSSPYSLEDAGNLGLVGMVEEFGGGLARLAHAHVERTVGREGKAAVGLVELHRRDADIERDGVDQADAALGEHAVHLAEALVDQGQARDPGRATAFAIASGSRSKPITRPAPPRAWRACSRPLRTCRRPGSRRGRRARRRHLEKHRHVRARVACAAGHASAALFEPEAGDVLQVLGDALVVEEQLRVPDLERLAGAEEQGEILDLPLRRIIGGTMMRPGLS